MGLFLLPCDAHGVDIRPVTTTDHHRTPTYSSTVHRFPRETGSTARSPRSTPAPWSGCARSSWALSDRALKIAAEYTTGREQFGRPIGSFQAVQQRLADAFIDVEAIRWTTWHAAWLIANERPLKEARRAACIAKFWAAEAGARVAATTQHVHGGIGIDITYPLHRYFLWAKHNELTLGSATAQLAVSAAPMEGNR